MANVGRDGGNRPRSAEGDRRSCSTGEGRWLSRHRCAATRAAQDQGPDRALAPAADRRDRGARVRRRARGRAESDCAGGEIYDDGSYENGYGGNPPTIETFQAVQLFTPAAYPATYEAVCVALTTLTEPKDLAFEIEVRDDDGPGGEPGTLLGTVDASASAIPVAGAAPYNCAFYRFETSGLGLEIADGSVFIGVRWATDDPNHFICADQSAETPLHPGSVNLNTGDGWQPTQTLFPGYRALAVRAIGRQVLLGLSTAPSSLDFGDQLVGTRGPTQSTAVASTGDKPLAIGAVGLTGASTGDFAVTSDDCSGVTLTAQQSCTVHLAFEPRSPGTKQALLRIPSNAPGSPHLVPLSGIGTPPPELLLRIQGNRLVLNRRGLTRVKLSCPSTEAGPCAGRLVLRTQRKVRLRGKRRNVVLARARFRVPAGGVRRARLRLGRPQLRLIRRQRAARRVRAIARVSDGAGNRARVVKRMRLVPKR